ncbi:hypothetical protein [Corallococcus terminator]|uniref:Hint domain-containing protein n=1 Tax=Corallococcus terminator TaxID=2316733 RepID=A0A3A8HPM9_9BACT|nr:hypothetical protein [Corallococcus terminator]RKG72478.1 hypothetical protein D7V88_38075 [Corallococcus terminator]
MRSPRLAQVLKLLVVGLLPSFAQAQDVQQARCNSDALTFEQAIARSEWARRCGLLRNTGGANAWVASTAAFDTSFAWAKEYRESDTSHAYTGNTHYNNVNYYYARSLYEATPMFSVFQETSGSTAGYWKWSHTSPLARPLFPTFESINVAGSGTQLYPHPTNTNDCRLFSTPTGTSPWVTLTRYTVCDDGPVYSMNAQGGGTAGEEVIREGCHTVTETVEKPFYVVAYCEAGCHPGDQLLGSSTGEAALGEDPPRRINPVSSDTPEPGDGEHVVYELTTESGDLLRVPAGHPVLTSEGRRVKAESLLLGDALLRRDGTPDRIVTVKQTLYFAKVHDVRRMSHDAVSDLLLTEGYRVGPARVQKENAEQLNRALRQQAIPAEVLPE